MSHPWLPTGSLLCGLAVAGAAAAAPARAATTCAALVEAVRLPNVTLTLAAEVPAGGFELPRAANGAECSRASA